MSETWKYSQEQRRSDIVRGTWRPINGEPPLATKVFEVCRRIAAASAFLQDVEDDLNVYLGFYEGTPTAKVLAVCEAVADGVEKAARVHRAHRPTGYRHDAAAAAAALDHIEATCGWWHDEFEAVDGGSGPRWGRYTGDEKHPEDTKYVGRTVGPLAKPGSPNARQVVAPITIVDRLPRGCAVLPLGVAL